MSSKQDIKPSIDEVFPGLWTYRRIIERSENALSQSKSSEVPLTTLLHYYRLRCENDLENLKEERSKEFYGNFNNDDELKRIEDNLKLMIKKLSEEVEILVAKGFVNEFTEEQPIKSEERDDDNFFQLDWTFNDSEFIIENSESQPNT